MMYNLLGRLVWMIGTRVAKKKLGQNRAKAGALGVVALVILGGVLAARAGSGDD
jgi:hypothetical protein